MDEDTMIDVIGFEDHEKENEWNGRNKSATATINNNNNNSGWFIHHNFTSSLSM
jgi:hypothetical protein